jgi:hypothetical protein
MARWYMTVRGREVMAGKREAMIMMHLPYGLWTCEDGREVLFNRFYEPLWERRPGEPAKAGDPHENVPPRQMVHPGKLEWIYDDQAMARRKKPTLKRCVEVLEAWGVLTPDLKGTPGPSRAAGLGSRS